MGWYCHEDRQIIQCKKKQSLEIDPYTHNHLIFNKGEKTLVENNYLFNRWYWNKQTLYAKIKIKFDPYIAL